MLFDVDFNSLFLHLIIFIPCRGDDDFIGSLWRAFFNVTDSVSKIDVFR